MVWGVADCGLAARSNPDRRRGPGTGRTERRSPCRRGGERGRRARKGGKQEDPGGARTPHPQGPPPNARGAGGAWQRPPRQEAATGSNVSTPNMGLGPGGAQDAEVAVDGVREARRGVRGLLALEGPTREEERTREVFAACGNPNPVLYGAPWSMEEPREPLGASKASSKHRGGSEPRHGPASPSGQSMHRRGLRSREEIVCIKPSEHS